MRCWRRLQEHIETLVGRYKGRVWAWDVVNEAIDEGRGWRKSQWLNIIGDDFMERAFRFAHAVDPKAQLLYNDYNMHNPAKRAFLVDVLKDYLDRGVPINGVGLQGHVGLDYPNLEEWEKSIATYADMGLQVHITELDVDVLPSRLQYRRRHREPRAVRSATTTPTRQGLPRRNAAEAGRPLRADLPHPAELPQERGARDLLGPARRHVLEEQFPGARPHQLSVAVRPRR